MFYINLFSQTYVFFSDSPNSTYYDPSWGFNSGGSLLEMINSSKFPVESSMFYTGTNCLRLKWTSKSGGDWGLAVAEPGWPGHDVTTKDSIIMWVYSATDISSSLLPLMYLEDLNNNKSNKQSIAAYAGDIKGNIWNRVSIPIQIFRQMPGNTDMKKIKTLYFGQNSPDGVQHIIYIDDIRMISKSASIPATPQNVAAKGYQRHIDIMWDLIDDNTIEGYKVYRLVNLSYQLVGTVNKNDRFYSDFIDSTGFSGTYKITTFNSGLVESSMSQVVTASTKSLSDAEMLTMVQEATFRYFWDYAHPTSGLMRERYNSGNTVTTGGSGFGIYQLLLLVLKEDLLQESRVFRGC